MIILNKYNYIRFYSCDLIVIKSISSSVSSYLQRQSSLENERFVVRGFQNVQIIVAGPRAQQPEKHFFMVVVGVRGKVVVNRILFEKDLVGLGMHLVSFDLVVLDFNCVAAQHHREDAGAGQHAVGGHGFVEYDDDALRLNKKTIHVIEMFLTQGFPDIDNSGAAARKEGDAVDQDAVGWNVFGFGQRHARR